MHDVWLLTALGAFYVWECVAWCRHDTTVLTGWRAWRFRRGPALPLGDRGGLITGRLLPPFETAIGISAWPFVLREESLEFEGQSLPYDALKPGSAGRVLILDGRRRLRLHSARAAAQLANLIRRVAASPATNRSTIISDAACAARDVSVIESRLAALVTSGRPLRITASLLGGFLIVVLPVIVLQMGLAFTWRALLLVLIALTAPVVVTFCRAHRTLYPDDREDRVTRAVTMALAPVGAVRGLDAIAWDVVTGFDPLAVTAVACDRPTFVREARRARFDAKRAGDASLQSIERLIDRMNVREEVLRPPVSEDPSTQSYCPRCGNQYVAPSGSCADCEEVRLVSLDYRE
jgi:hypothetical protein